MGLTSIGHLHRLKVGRFSTQELPATQLFDFYPLGSYIVYTCLAATPPPRAIYQGEPFHETNSLPI